MTAQTRAPDPGDSDSDRDPGAMICRACRRQLAAAASSHRSPSLRSSQSPWQSRASSSTASTETPAFDAHSNEDYTPSIDVYNEEPRFTADGPQGPVKNSQPPSSRFKHVPRNLRLRKFAVDSREESMRIFQRVVEQQAKQNNSPEPKERDMSPASVAFYSGLSRLKPMLKEESIDRCFDFFMTLWSNPEYQNIRFTRLVQQKGVRVLGRVVEAKKADMDNQKLPSMARITQLYYELDSLSPAKWVELIMGLIKSIITRSGARADYESDEAYQKAKARKEELLDDLVESWILFNRHRLSANLTDLQTSEAGEFRIPPLTNDARLRYFASHGDLIGAMGMIFPRFEKHHQQVPAAAIATFVLMVDPNHSNIQVRRKIKPLLDPIARILTEVDVRIDAMRKTLAPYPEILAYVLNMWNTIIQRLRGIQGTGLSLKLKRDSEIIRGRLGRSGRSDWPAIHAQVTGALKMGDVTALETVWKQYCEDVAASETSWKQHQDAIQKDVSRMKEKEEEQHKIKKLFDYFIMAFTALRRPQRAISVWDAMVQTGISPTLETWTSMIEGCRRSRNAVALEKVWKKLLASGEQLDYKVWSARVVGLMDCREPEAGLRALGEMHRMSKNGGVPLNVHCINAAIAGLIRHNAEPAAQKVLAWGSENGIDPDVVTFNTLLRPLVSRGNAPEVMGLIRTMGECGIEPDGTTYTILLDGLISKTRDAPPGEQRQSTQELIADIERSGVQTNLMTFARMIYLLLSPQKDHSQTHQHRHTEGAVGAIYDHIYARGLRPSVHIYTMMITYYLSLTPPVIAQVDRLLADSGILRDIKNTANHVGGALDATSAAGAAGRVDRVFWERLIKGFATTPGYVDRAFELFERAGNVGSWMTLDALETLVRCLVRAGRTAEAKRVVDKVKSHRAITHEHGMRDRSDGMATERPPTWIWNSDHNQPGRYWKHGFWSFAYDRGLLSMQEYRELPWDRSSVPGVERGA